MCDKAIPSWPDVLTYKKVTVYSAFYPDNIIVGFSGGPDWPDWDREPRARHFVANGRLADQRPGKKPPSKRVADGPSHFWIGPLHGSFGHAVAELWTRIAPTLKACPQAVLVFSDVSDPYGRGKGFGLLNALYEWYDIPEHRRMIVTEPTEFETLYVVPQPELLDDHVARQGSAVVPCENYLNELQSHVLRNLGSLYRNRSVFVSRSKQDFRFLGEDYLDRVFAKAGFEIFYPEHVPLREQIRAYAEAKTLVFSEGSAVHGAQLLGELGNVIVLARRPGSTLARANLGPRTSRLRYIDCCRNMLAVYATGGLSHMIAEWAGRSVLDVNQLLTSLKEEEISVSEFWDQSEFEVRQRDDLRALMSTKARPSIARDPRSFHLWIEGLRRSGIQAARDEGATLIGGYIAGGHGPSLLRRVHRRVCLYYYDYFDRLPNVGAWRSYLTLRNSARRLVLRVKRAWQSWLSRFSRRQSRGL